MKVMIRAYARAQRLACNHNKNDIASGSFETNRILSTTEVVSEDGGADDTVDTLTIGGATNADYNPRSPETLLISNTQNIQNNNNPTAIIQPRPKNQLNYQDLCIGNQCKAGEGSSNDTSIDTKSPYVRACGSRMTGNLSVREVKIGSNNVNLCIGSRCSSLADDEYRQKILGEASFVGSADQASLNVQELFSQGSPSNQIDTDNLQASTQVNPNFHLQTGAIVFPDQSTGCVGADC